MKILKNKKNVLAGVAALLLVVATVFIVMFFTGSVEHIESYEESGNASYVVNLNKNKYYSSKTLGEDLSYVSSIVKNIEATFKYKMKATGSANLSYSVVAHVKVEDNNGKEIYSYDDTLMAPKNLNGCDIDTKVVVPYTTYNKKTSSFINAYNLSSVSSSVVVKLIVIDPSLGQSTEELIIPLNQKTFSITNENHFNMINHHVYTTLDIIYYVFALVGVVFYIVAGCLIYLVVSIVLGERTPEEVYTAKKNRILNNYDAYIQKSTNSVDFKVKDGLKIDGASSYKNAQIINLSSFEDLAAIRDGISNAPILFLENKKQTESVFLILDLMNQTIYTYGMQVEK